MTVNGFCKRLMLIEVFLTVSVVYAFAQNETIPPFVSTTLQDTKNGDSFPKTENRITPRRPVSLPQTQKQRKPDPQLTAFVKRADALFDRYSYSSAFDQYTKAMEYVKQKDLYDSYPDTVTHIYIYASRQGCLLFWEIY